MANISAWVADRVGTIAGTTTASALNNKEMARRSPAMDPISALTYETLTYREVIPHPEVNERIEAAFLSVTSQSSSGKTRT
ncbi:MAG: hypothetical protein ACRDY7_04195 [Acidimicrobiia bacterium]